MSTVKLDDGIVVKEKVIDSARGKAREGRARALESVGLWCWTNRLHQLSWLGWHA